MDVKTTVATVKTTVTLIEKIKKILDEIFKVFINKKEKKVVELVKKDKQVSDLENEENTPSTKECENDCECDKQSMFDKINEEALDRKTPVERLKELSEHEDETIRNNALATIKKLKQLERRRIARRKKKLSNPSI